MKKVFYLLLLISNSIFSQNHLSDLVTLPYYPSFHEMATRFFNSYSLPEPDYDKQYSFAKKPDGWHILLVDLTNDKVVRDDLFWEKASGMYRDVSYQKIKPEKSVDIPSDYDTWENNYFNSISPLFGYKGWDTDVINEYGSKTNLSDFVLYALARAYSEHAWNLLNTYLGSPNSNITYKKQRTLNSLTAEQLKNYRKFEHLSIDAFKKILQQNPKYEDFVGNIRTVYSNHIMACFLTIRFHQNEAEAKKELKPGLYDPFYRCIAKNYLASCDSNAVIFTNGDSDTYPLLYVQESEGFRKDVLVINVSMLQSPQYINHLFKKIGLSDPLDVFIEKNLYTNGSLPYAYIIVIGKEKPIELKDLMAFINSSDPSTKYRSDSEYLTYVPTTHIRYTVHKENAIKNRIVDMDDTSKIESVMDWHIPKRTVLYQNEIAILDILARADFRRPVYFAVTVADEYFLNLEKYFQLEGLAYKVVPIKSETNEDQYGRVNTKILYNKLKYRFCNMKWESDTFVSTDRKRMVSSYRIQYSRLAEALIDENKPDSANEVLTLCFENFPVRFFPLDYWTIPHIKCYYRLNKKEIANEMTRVLMKKYFTELQIHEQDILPLSKENNSIQLAIYSLNELSNLTKQFKEEELNKIISSELNKYKSLYQL